LFGEQVGEGRGGDEGEGELDRVKFPGHRPGLPGHAVASGMRAKEISF